MAVITISREFGAGGRSLGREIADEMGYTFADNEIIQMIAEKANVSEGWVESVERDAGTRFSRVIAKVFPKKLASKLIPKDSGYIDEKLYLDYLVVIIAQLGDEDNVVILGRGSQYILRDIPDSYHVLLVNEFENRVKYIEKFYGIDNAQATELVASEDRRRKGLYRKLGKEDYDNPVLYDLVLHTGKMNKDRAKELIYALMKK